MGYTKLREDVMEVFLDNTQSLVGISQKSKHTISKYVCPYCHCVHHKKENLFSHIKEQHNIMHPVVIVNDKVIDSTDFYINKIETAQVYTYGFSDPVVVNEVLISVDNETGIDITQKATELFEKNGRFSITVGDRTINVMKFSVSAIRNDLVNPTIREWEHSIEEKKMISFKTPSELNTVETEYLKGFYNYFIACLASGAEKATRYYDAYNILSSFNPNNALAVCVLKVISFKFNWTKRLGELCKKTSDEFNQIMKFYNNSEIDEPKSTNYNDSLFIEDELREYIDAVEKYLLGELEEVNKYIKKYTITDIEDKNFKDRILLLSAKLCIKENRLKEAYCFESEILCEDFKNMDLRG